MISRFISMLLASGLVLSIRNVQSGLGFRLVELTTTTTRQQQQQRPIMSFSLSFSSSRGTSTSVWASQQQQQESQSFSSSSSSSREKDDNESMLSSYSVKVTYEGRSCDVLVEPNESILMAMERSNTAHELGLPDLPSDCRRGNCLTCTATHSDDSIQTNLNNGSNGLTPTVSNQINKNGYVLTCSSYVRGNGVHLQLGQNSRVWDEMYRDRFESEETQCLARKVVANVIRKNAERHSQEWIQQTEEIFKKKI